MAQSLSFLYVLLKLLLLISTILGPEGSSKAYLESACLSLAAACILCPLSFLEHTRSVRPSSLILLYLAISVIGHAIQLSLFGYQQPNPGNLGLELTQVCVELVLLVSESSVKETTLKSQHQELSTEELSSIIGRTFFWWIIPILRKGHGKILDHADLPNMDSKLSSESLRRNILLSWDQRSTRGVYWTCPNLG